MSPYTGPTMRGVDYSPTWPDWVQGPENTQTNDSDFANDAFQSLWSNQYEAAPSGDKSRPHNNGNLYRNDLGPISSHRFNLVRPYDWNMARGSSLETGPAVRSHQLPEARPCLEAEGSGADLRLFPERC